MISTTSEVAATSWTNWMAPSRALIWSAASREFKSRKRHTRRGRAEFAGAWACRAREIADKQKISRVTLMHWQFMYFKDDGIQGLGYSLWGYRVGTGRGVVHCDLDGAIQFRERWVTNWRMSGFTFVSSAGGAGGIFRAIAAGLLGFETGFETAVDDADAESSGWCGSSSSGELRMAVTNFSLSRLRR